MVFVKNFFRAADVADFLRALLPGHGQQPVQIVARDGGLGRHRRHSLKLLQFLHCFVAHLLGHAGGFDLFLQLIELAFLAPAQLFLDGLDLLVKVVLFLCPLHLSFYTRLDGAIHIQFFNFDVQYVTDPGQPLRRIKDFQQFLFFLDGKLQVSRNRIRKFGRIFHAHSRDHGFIVQRLAQFHILFEQSRDPLHAGFDLRVSFSGIASDAE